MCTARAPEHTHIRVSLVQENVGPRAGSRSPSAARVPQLAEALEVVLLEPRVGSQSKGCEGSGVRASPLWAGTFLCPVKFLSPTQTQNFLEIPRQDNMPSAFIPPGTAEPRTQPLAPLPTVASTQAG